MQVPKHPYILKEPRDQLYANHFVRTARKCFKIPISNRRRVFRADEFDEEIKSNELDFEVDQEKLCSSLNLPLSRKPDDEYLNKYGPHRFEECREGRLSEKYDYYNRTVGDSIRSIKERNAHLKKISNFRQFLRNKRETDVLPCLEEKYAYGPGNNRVST